MSADLQNRAAQAVEMAKAAGADDAWATASQGRDVEFEFRDGALEKVKDTTSALEPDEHRRITPAELFAGRPSDDLDLVDPTVAEISREQRLKWCESLDRVATDHERVISATAGVYDGTLNSASASSNGFVGSHAETYCWYGSNITLRDEGEKRASGGWYAGGQHIEQMSHVSGWIARLQDLARKRVQRSRRRCSLMLRLPAR
jgi:PmbA protein